MDEDEIEKAVVAYLKKKGFKQTELAFQEEQQLNNNNNNNNSANSQIDPDITKKILSFSELCSASLVSCYVFFFFILGCAALESRVLRKPPLYLHVVVIRFETGPERYQEEYSKLRSWAYSSLDLYKHELLRVLYPVFIHCFMELVAKGHLQEARAFFNSYREDHEMTHLRDLQKLEGVLSPSHLEEMEFAHSIRMSKVNIKMCQYSYDLLLQYLHKSESITMLGIINERINFQVSPGQPGSISDDAEVVTLVASGHDASLINQKEVHWGLLEDSLEERIEKTGGSVPDAEKFDGDPKEGEVEENKKKSVEGGKQGAPLKKLKKDKVGVATGKSSRTESSTVTTAPRVKPELALPAIIDLKQFLDLGSSLKENIFHRPAEVELSILEDLRNRVQLSNASLPSVSFYTFVNTHNGLNCASISHDGSLVAGGFSDSSLKVWDMAKLGQQTGPCKSNMMVLNSF
ncbi:Transcription initiation factor TFIID subunit 5 [Capsicum annuum]|nr:Transcription initiation factor TFIID subunit 5 [Capsicum annuum]